MLATLKYCLKQTSPMYATDLLGSGKKQSIILLFGQQMEPPHSLSRSRNFHVNRRKIEK